MSINSLSAWYNKLLDTDRMRLDKELSSYLAAIKINDVELAESLLREHIEANPYDEVALCDYAMIEKSRGNIEEAVSYLKRAVKAHASYPRSRSLLGRIYLELNDFKSAETYLYSCFTKKPSSKHALELSKAYLGLNDDKKAIRYIKKAIKLDKYNRDAYQAMIENLCKKEQA